MAGIVHLVVFWVLMLTFKRNVLPPTLWLKDYYQSWCWSDNGGGCGWVI